MLGKDLGHAQATHDQARAKCKPRDAEYHGEYLRVVPIHRRITAANNVARHSIIGNCSFMVASCPYRKLDSSVAMMQTAEHGLSNDATKLLDRSADRRVLA